MWIGTICALLLAGCLAVDSNRVASLTRQFVEKMKAPNPTNLQAFYDEDAVLSLDKTFGFGGNFEGPEGVELFLFRMLPEIVNQPLQFQVLGIDEARGTSLLKMEVSGTFARTGKHFNTSILHVLEWNPVVGKIITHLALDLNPAQTFAAYQTEAEKYFTKLLWTLFRSSYEQLTDIKSPLWQLISDNIQVKINGYPEDLLTKMEWHGKEEVVKGFKEMEGLERNMPIYKHLLTRTNLIDAKVLLSTDTDAWVRWGYKKGEDEDDVITQAVVHYVFDKDGKLRNQEITLAHAVRPWVVYPFPAPKQPEIDAKQVRKLMMTRNMLAGEQQFGSIVQHDPSALVQQQQPSKQDTVVDQSQSRPFGSGQSIVTEQNVPEVDQKWVFSEQKPVGQEYGLGERVETPKMAQVSEQQVKPVGQKALQIQTKPVVGEKQVYEFGKREEQSLPNSLKRVRFEDLKQAEKGKEVDQEDAEDKEKDEELDKDDEKKKDDTEDDTEDEEDKIDLETPAFIHVEGDINTRIKPGFESKFRGTMPPMDVEVHGDMKTSVVTFGSGKVDSVEFIGTIDELELEKPSLLLHGAKEARLT